MDEGLDVKSLFKPKKKGLKAFKLGGADESADKVESHQASAPVSIDLVIEPELVPVPSIKLQDVPEFKAPTEDSIKKTSSVGWGSNTVEEAPKVIVQVPVVEETTKPAKYVPFSGNRGTSTATKAKPSDMPSLAEAVRISKPAAPAQTGYKAPAPVVSAEELARKEKEKEERKKKLQEEILRTTSVTSSVPDDLPDDCRIQAASAAEIAAKYVNRSKIGRSF